MNWKNLTSPTVLGTILILSSGAHAAMTNAELEDAVRTLQNKVKKLEGRVDYSAATVHGTYRIVSIDSGADKADTTSTYGGISNGTMTFNKNTRKVEYVGNGVHFRVNTSGGGSLNEAKTSGRFTLNYRVTRKGALKVWVNDGGYEIVLKGAVSPGGQIITLNQGTYDAEGDSLTEADNSLMIGIKKTR